MLEACSFRWRLIVLSGKADVGIEECAVGGFDNPAPMLTRCSRASEIRAPVLGPSGTGSASAISASTESSRMNQ